MNSLNEYEKKVFVNNNSRKIGKEFNNEKIPSFQLDFDTSRDDYLAILNDIDSILSNCSELSYEQKLDFCNNQRYYMKLYLKELLIRIKNI